MNHFSTKAKLISEQLNKQNKMANLRTLNPTNHIFLTSLILTFTISIQINKVFSYQYKVGDLDAWGIPTQTNSHVYAKWSKLHIFKIGDSLLFLYPPSQDSVLQVTGQSFNSCDLKDPILSMNNGNSLFNITSEGEFFFISGQKGHCEKRQKLQILVGNVTATAFSPAYGPSGMADTAPSSPTAFGSIPTAPSSSSSIRFAVSLLVGIEFLVCALLGLGIGGAM